MTKKQVKNEQTGRSMVEMLGVLAIIGVLSVGGVYGYTIAMKKHKANEILNEASKRAVIVASQIAADKSLSIAEFSENEFYGATFTGVTGNTNGTFTLNLTLGDTFDPTICDQMKSISGDNGIIKGWGTNDDCSGITFNNDLSNGESTAAVDPLCADITCGFGYTCENGSCVATTSCDDISCAVGYTCNEGTCVKQTDITCSETGTSCGPNNEGVCVGGPGGVGCCPTGEYFMGTGMCCPGQRLKDLMGQFYSCCPNTTDVLVQEYVSEKYICCPAGSNVSVNGECCSDVAIPEGVGGEVICCHGTQVEAFDSTATHSICCEPDERNVNGTCVK